MRAFLKYILAFTVSLKQTAEAVNVARTAEELDELLKRQ